MLGLGRCHLIHHSLHTPACCGVVILVVGIDAHIVPGDIHGGDVVSQLLIIGTEGILDGLPDAGGQGGVLSGEHGVVGIAGLGSLILAAFAAFATFAAGLSTAFAAGLSATFATFAAFAGICGAVAGIEAVTGQGEEVIRKGIAAGLTEVIGIGDATVSLQHLQADVAAVDIINGLADILPGVQIHALEAVIHEILRTVHIRQLLGEVGGAEGIEGSTGLQLGIDVVGIHIAVEVIHAEGIIRIHAEAVCQDVGSHLVHSTLGHIAVVMAVEDQVADIACPAAQVAGLHRSHIGDVHGAEHMAEVHALAIGDGEVLEIAQVHGGGAVGGILSLDILREYGDLLACQGRPVAIQVAVHARTKEVDHQKIGIGVAAVGAGELIGIAL